MDGINDMTKMYASKYAIYQLIEEAIKGDNCNKILAFMTLV